MNKEKYVEILGVNIRQSSLDSLVLEAQNAMQGLSDQISFSCANPHSLVTAISDSRFTESLNASDQVVVDGSGLKLLADFTGIDLGDRITGNDYFTAIIEYLELRGRGKVFFFGSSSLVLNSIVKRFKGDYPMLECAVYSPPYGEWSDDANEEMIEVINRFEPDVLWVGMTAPKQEKWVETHRAKLLVPVIGSIGAVFDFYAGTYPRAPKLMCDLGIEWLYRLLKEPKRMWKRNFISTPIFIYTFFVRHVLSHEGSHSVYSTFSTSNHDLVNEKLMSDLEIPSNNSSALSNI